MTTLLAPLLMLLLINLGNGQNDPSIRCPFRLSCARRHNNQQVLEFPAFPVPARFQVIDIDCKSQELFLSDTQNCLPRLFLRNNYSLFYPFRLASPLVSYNITFFNCSSVAQHHLKSWEQTNPGVQDMLSCPIYAAGFGESVVGLDLFRCTKILDQVLPVEPIDIRLNYLRLNWSETSLDSECLEYEQQHKSKKKTISIILAAAGEIDPFTSIRYYPFDWNFFL